MNDLRNILDIPAATHPPLRTCTVEQILDRIEAEKHPAIRRMMAQMLYDRGKDDAMNVIRPKRWQTRCPDCNGEGETAPNGVKYCNCPVES